LKTALNVFIGMSGVILFHPIYVIVRQAIFIF